MNKRKVSVAIVALLLVVVTAAWWLAPDAEKLALDLTFLRYTNEALPAQTPEGSAMVFYNSVALMQVSNAGNRRLELWNSVSARNFGAQDFGVPMPHGFPNTLDPGQSAMIRVRPARPPWRTEIGYRRREARERALGRIWKMAGKTGQRWLSSSGLWADFNWVAIGPITNALPELPRIIAFTNYSMDLRDLGLYRANERPFNIHQLLTNFPPKASVDYKLPQK